MKTPLTFLLSLTFLFLFSGSVYGDDFQDGLDAYNRKENVSISNRKSTRYGKELETYQEITGTYENQTHILTLPHLSIFV